MWRIWLLFDPRRVLVAMTVALVTMVLLLHFIMISGPTYDIDTWAGGPPQPAASTAAP
ncbi:light-harvesting protein [Brevundimonas sp. AJA228-03]|uniref:light-harvesting antenna LH1, alpha subunit n=1 Tax=Brevundimonas sp. AJA228-03 TaxID=2752515 RepID=UPI001AE00266|nr:light-harvesting antenna LH1, alpha subunit [Brevundimonas sp. AJA228-03]QTN20354.1 light-harvesting protein [Brevundimonas sp. AJA228-03]